MASFTSAGSTIGVSAALPATNDDTGFNALTFTLIGEVTDLGEFGKVYNRVDHLPLASRQIVKRKGSFDNGTIQMVAALDNDDAGQIILQAAADSDNAYAFEITTQSGDLYNFQALVMSESVSVGTTDQITSVTFQLEITEEIVLQNAP